ncbi:hypothetical protein A2851_03785 [Candidatus Kaiserbacteria bacterium RIFCSPHIGHO2_01_FULL_53_29]|uniref:Lycopene cyclase domain-containing protein n=1 Tax=Candidatus Kaiserbacteria bacterium RIFCSPHIGHO2_01_FULL_53_29 TaxID=1798480 RepID=A0A1F6CWR8_9BACT|nr:MAG: hypothetical protein A2851_03785 [Candidatus Kaiserbacteria bacterium RIFCSPHIGHO2_01_FULL_53_29]
MIVSQLDSQFFYFTLTVPFVLLWLVVFWISPSTRRELIRSSILFALAGVVVENLFYFHDYWRPQGISAFHIGTFVIYPEFILFGGSLGGIAATAYQVCFRTTLIGSEKAHVKSRIVFVTAVFFATTLLAWQAGINSIFATSLGAVAISLGVVYIRRDLLVPAFMSGILTLGVMVVSYTIFLLAIGNIEEIGQRAWLLYGSDLDIRLLGIPITELVWGFSVGSAIGILRAFMHDAHFSPNHISPSIER